MKDKRSGGKPSILLIDDSQDCLDILSRTLTQFGYPNLTFTDPRLGFEAYRLERFDVVISDYQMPGMSGIELLEKIKFVNPQACVMILTGFADTTSAIEAVNKGAHSFFCKPVDMKSLLERLSRIEQELRRTEEQEDTLIELCFEYNDLLDSAEIKNRQSEGPVLPE